MGAHDPDIGVMDAMRPAMDGYEATRLSREFSQVPIVMLTAKTEQSDKLKGFDAGADDYITKPFSPEELVARIRAVLKRSQAQPEPKRVAPALAKSSLNLAKPPSWASIAAASVPLGAPPLPGPILVQKNEWLECPTALLRTPARLASGTCVMSAMRALTSSATRA